MNNKEIIIKGARSNNLKNIDVTIPRNQFVVVTGVSGSGKSTLTMDTLYAEGQRRYVESLSSYARQFLGRMKKPDVDYIKGICPAIAIEQRVSSSNARSTVGSMTETNDYLRLLYARVGRTFSPVSGLEVKKNDVTDVVNFIQKLPETTAVFLLIAFNVHEGRNATQELNLLLQKGFTRLWRNHEIIDIEDVLTQKNDADKTNTEKTDNEKNTENRNEDRNEHTYLLIDRFKVAADDDELRKRIGDSVQTCFNESSGACFVFENEKYTLFNNKFEMDGLEFPEPTPFLFNYNNPYGACPVCEGYGKTLGIDLDKVIPDKSKSVYEGAIACWRGETMGEWHKAFLQNAHKFEFPVHRAYRDLAENEKETLWTGNQYFQGIKAFFEEIEAQTYKIQYRVLLARYRGKTHCPACKGTRLRKEASYVKVGNTPMTKLIFMPISQLNTHFKNLELNENDTKVAKRLVQEIATRLEFMERVGLGYLHLDRQANTLSGGETQRIHLTRSLGSNLTSSMYLLDEPSIGLHPRDTNRLVDVLKNLRDLGNTVIVVEHEEDMIRNADYLIDIGPAAGIHGGEVVFQGAYNTIYTKANDSLTAKYLTGRMGIEVPSTRRKFFHKLVLKDVRQHNLKGFDVEIPLGILTVVTGVSGSGKTTLIKQIFYPALQKAMGENTAEQTGDFEELTGDIKKVTQIEMVNQNPIGKSSRSNPVTYVKAYDEIRELFTDQQLSKIKGFKPKHFSFNVEGGRCETCKGEGEQLVEMQFLADVRLECEDCKGKRFQQDVLDVEYNGKNISEVLDLSIEQALAFFQGEKSIIQKIKPLFDVGLGYVRLGQSSNTLSGGEAQRVKLASFLVREKNKEHIVFVFDEPTTGLHFHDIGKLLTALNALVERGHTVIVIEHNLEVVKCADWVLDLGPEGGNEGGHLVFAGTPENLIHCKNSYTGAYLKQKLV
ncbi:MAG: excinuclease subunit UvrA [Bacteroidota bacterium]|jgi:excinuclease ABC subunit A